MAHQPDLGMSEYAEKNDLFSTMSSLLSGLLLEQPDKPIDWMISALRKRPVPSVVVIGPPTSGISAVSSLIARRLGCQYISVSQLIQQAVTKGTTLGLQAKPYLDKSKPVPDPIVMALLNSSLSDPDTQERGYVLEGFPQSREQGLLLARRGILPNHLVVFDVPDHTLLSAYNAAPTLKLNLAEFRRHIPGVMDLFPSRARKWTFEEGLGRVVDDAAQAALTFLTTTPISNAPRGIRLMLSSLPGNVTEEVAELCANRYGCVLVSPRIVILEQISARSTIGATLQRYTRAPHEAPTDVIAQLVAKRIRQPDCVEHGWILANFPTNLAELEALKKQFVSPTRLIWLDTPSMTCLARMTIQTGDSNLSRTRLASAVRLKDEIGSTFGVKRVANDAGIMQTVDATDVGSQDTESDADSASSILRVYERVVDALQRDVPMTGLDVNTEHIIEIAVIITDADLNIVAEGPNIIVHQPKSVMDAMGEWCTKQHGESGLTASVLASPTSTSEAESQIIAFLESNHVPKGKLPLAGNTVHADKAFLKKEMPKLVDFLHYRIVDVSTVKELTRRWYPDVFGGAPQKAFTHRALDDIKESIGELAYYKKHAFKAL
ncbi:hypothetical protein SmJEL517_g01774 [Synchytrium microbalum]|uniref:Exonuclease domain-containing protein n=1 Tax=Synchytrium microbalum TaxID=1806994 RepID=A0A507CEL9_9FUNG|nr:uncharacterized protein SmJEL517_g01774 [Synchytrium microbalum]TPX36025.1 hypothetical protein SmJEL517_g01774 [Synchytrium microbalum]